MLVGYRYFLKDLLLTSIIFDVFSGKVSTYIETLMLASNYFELFQRLARAVAKL